VQDKVWTVERKMEKGAVERRGQWATEGDHLTHNINKGKNLSD